MSAMEKTIRELAYELWEQAGRPDDRSDEFWFAARFELERTTDAASWPPSSATRPRTILAMGSFSPARATANQS